MVDRGKFWVVALLGLSLAAIGFGEFAGAQSPDALRRAALRAAQESVKAGELADAVDVLQPLADNGDALAQYSLGVIYITGGTDVPKDSGKAIAWFTKAAGQGQAGAMRELALIYEKGRAGVPVNMATALDWFDKGANRGDAYAQMLLGLKYMTGEGVPKDSMKAYFWLTLADRGIFFDDEAQRKAATKQARATLVAQLGPTEVQKLERDAAGFSAH